MGKWKYINLGVLMIVLVFMYRHFYYRYHAHQLIYWITTIGWLIMLVAGYYVFEYRLNRGKKTAQTSIPPKVVSTKKERPKVILKKSVNNEKS